MIVALLLAGGCADISLNVALDQEVIDPLYGGHEQGSNTSEEDPGDSGVPVEDVYDLPDDTGEILEQAVQVWTWSGRTPTRLRALQGSIGGRVMLADLTGDGRLEVIHLNVTASGDRSELTIWPGTPVGPGPSMTLPLAGACTSALVEDLNGDGHPDLLASTGAVVQFFAGRPGGFTPPEEVEQTAGVVVLGAADLDGDGVAEAVTVVAGATTMLMVWAGGSNEGLSEVGSVDLGPGVLPPMSLAPLALAGHAGSVGLLAEARPDSSSTRYVQWDHANERPVLAELDVVRDTCMGCPMVAAFGEDLDADGQSEVVSTGLTGLYTWNPALSAVREVRAGDAAQEHVLGLTRVDLDGDGANDALELISRGLDAAHAELRLQPSLARGGALEAAAPFVVDASAGALLGATLVAAQLDDDDCADAVVLDGMYQPWLVRGLCRPEAP